MCGNILTIESADSATALYLIISYADSHYKITLE